jgi:thioesterase domain-containing protein
LFIGVGYSGNLALELATQLWELGIENTRVLLLDTAFPAAVVTRRFWKSEGSALDEARLPRTYRDLSEVERTAWLTHQPEKYSQGVVSVTSAKFRAELSQSDSLDQLLKREEVSIPQGSLLDISEEVLTNIRTKLR